MKKKFAGYRGADRARHGIGLRGGLPARTYTKAPAYVPAPIYNWTGFYIGGHVGGAFAGSNDFGNNDGRFLGGVQVGADYQFAPNWVLGIEGQYSWTGRDTRAAAFVPGGLTINDRTSNLGSVTGRLGYTWGPALLYAKGGVAFREKDKVFVTNTATGLATPFTSSSDDVGYTVGAGLEYLFAPSWSAKVEYQYYNFGKTNDRPRVGHCGQLHQRRPHREELVSTTTSTGVARSSRSTEIDQISF